MDFDFGNRDNQVSLSAGLLSSYVVKQLKFLDGLKKYAGTSGARSHKWCTFTQVVHVHTSDARSHKWCTFTQVVHVHTSGARSHKF